MKAFIMICLALVMTGCAALESVSSGSRVPVQYATLKVIEDSSTITGRDVLMHTQRVRQLVSGNAELNLSSLLESTVERINLDSFDASDRLLLMILLNNIEQALSDVHPDMPPDQQRIRLFTLLDWIDQAARLAG